MLNPVFGQGLPNQGIGVPNTVPTPSPFNVSGYGVGVWGVVPVTSGTGYVPGDQITPSSLGTQNSILGGAYAGAQFVVASTQVVSATVAAGGTSCTGTTATLLGTTGTGGGGAFFTATAPIAGGAITNPITITFGGTYQVNPTTLTAEPVTGSSCSGAQLSVVMGVKYISVQNPGSYFSIAANPVTGVTQASTTGIGTGATFSVTFAAQASYIIPPLNSPNGTPGSQASFNYCQGYLCLNNNTTGVENTAFGWNALAGNTTGIFNTAFGVNALGAATLTGPSNTAFGVDAGRNMTSGSLNSMFGQSAGINLLSGATNTLIGIQTGQNITTGQSNSCLGYQTCLGAASSSASFNTAMGRLTASALTSAQFNAMFGNNVGRAVTSGGSNTLLGASVGSATLSTGSNNILIGAGSNASCDTAAGGTSGTFQVCATTGATPLMSGVLTAASLALTINGTFTLPTVATDAATTDASLCRRSSDGLVLIGSGTLGICLGTSSARYKHGIEDLDVGLSEVMRLRPVKYFLNSDHGDPTKLLYGFTAEEADGVMPKLVNRDIDGQPNTFDYLGVVPALVRAIQEMQIEINALRIAK